MLTYMKEPIQANIKAHSTPFRSYITVKLHNWLPEYILIIDIIIEHLSGGTVDKVTREHCSDAEIRIKISEVGRFSDKVGACRPS